MNITISITLNDEDKVSLNIPGIIALIQGSKLLRAIMAKICITRAFCSILESISE